MSDSPRIKVLVALPVLGQPRHSKRVDMLKEAGFEVEVAAFERDYHRGRVPNCPVTSLGKIEHGKYLRRLFKLVAALPKLRRCVRRNNVVYASGPDMAFISLVAGIFLRVPVVLEVGDIREIQTTPGITGAVVRALDRWLTRRCMLLVSTTVQFVNEYYRNWLHAKTPALILENKLEHAYVERVQEELRAAPGDAPRSGRPLRIGYFGLLRCPWSWRMLRELALRKPHDIEIVVAGYPTDPPDIVEQIKAVPNARYLGQYKSPDDLARLYGGVDLVWACYPPIGPHDWNLRWARPNRFYESCCFGRPLVSRDGSCDAVDVARYDIGFVVRDSDDARVVEQLANITPQEVERWQHNSRALPRRVYAYTDETEQLGQAIRGLVGAARSASR